MMQLRDIIRDVPGIKVIEGPTDRDIRGITYDSRQVEAGFIFCAIKGLNLDGHEFIAQAVKAGATAVVCDHLPVCDSGEATCILCEDSRQILAWFSDRFYGSPSRDLKVIGITGTNGKTTTAYYLRHILNKAGFATGLIGTTGVIYGDERISTLHTTPESSDLLAFLRDMLQAGMDTVVMEVSSHALHQGRSQTIDFNAAVFTNLSQDHLDYHKDLDDYLSAKRLLFQGLQEHDLAVVNADDPYSAAMLLGCEARIVSLSMRTRADYQILSWEQRGAHATLGIAIPLGEYDFSVRTVGKFNYYNVLSSIAVAIELGVEIPTAQEAVKDLPGVPGRLEDASGEAPFRIFIDYAHTPDALERVLRVLRESYPDARLISVFGCGGDRDRDKRPQMGRIATGISDLSIITDDNPRSEPSDQIIQEILRGVNTAANFKVIIDRTEAIETALATAKQGDVVAILGKGHEEYQEVKGQRIPFSDLAVIKLYRQDHGY